MYNHERYRPHIDYSSEKIDKKTVSFCVREQDQQLNPTVRETVLKQEEHMIREASSNYQISPNITRNIRQEIGRLNTTIPSDSKPLKLLTYATVHAILITLLLGIGSQGVEDYPEPFGLTSQSEMSVSSSAPITQNLERNQNVQNQLAKLSDEDDDSKGGEDGKNSNQLTSNQGDYTTWALPKDAKVRFGKGRIKQIEYSPDSNQLAVATPIGIWIYDSQSGEELNLLTGHSSEVDHFAYSPDGATIATGAWDGVRLWDVATGKPKALIKTKALRSLTFSPDSTTIVTGSNFGPVELWDVTTGQRKAEFVGHTSIVSSMACSPDKTTIATASNDKTVRLWDIATGQTKATLAGHTESVTSVTYSPDGYTIATTSLDDTVRIWDAFSGNHIETLTAHQHYVSSVQYSPDGNTIATMGWDGIIFWHVDVENDEVTIKGRISSVSALAYSPNGKTIAVASLDGTAYLYDTDAINPSDKQDLSSKGKPLFSGHRRWANCVTYSQDGTTFATANWKGIHLWNAETGKYLRTFKGHTDNVYSIAFSPDGARILAASWDGIGHLWEVDIGEYKRLRVEDDSQSSGNNKGYVTRRDFVTSAIFSPDGKTIASAIDEKTIRLWDTETGKLTNSLTGHTDYISSIAFSPDGATIASVSKDKTVRLWDIATGQQKSILTGHTDGVYSVAYSPDGKTIVTGAWYGDRVIRMWDATGNAKLPLRIVGGAVVSMAYSPDGTILATSSSSVVRLWDAATKQPKKTLTGHKGRVDNFAFSPDGNTIATVSTDGTMILWDVTQLGELK